MGFWNLLSGIQWAGIHKGLGSGLWELSLMALDSGARPHPA